MRYSDEQILETVNTKDKVLYKRLYDTYYAVLCRYASKLLRRRSGGEEEDIVQEVFIKLWEARELLREDDSPEGFLFIVTRNLVFNQYRKEVNEDYYKMTVLSALESSYDIEEEIAARDLSRYIDRLIEELPEKRRQIFNLSRKAHKSHKEIALLLGISEKTVENQIREALRFLRKNMLLLICF